MFFSLPLDIQKHINEFEQVITNELEEAIIFAEKSKFPAKDELLKDVL